MWKRLVSLLPKPFGDLLLPASGAAAFASFTAWIAPFRSESLASAPWIKHHVEAPCVALAEALRRFASTGVRRGSVRLLHSLDRSIRGQIAEFATDLGGAERLTLAAPFHDAVALDRLCDQLGLDEAFVHSHSAGTEH